MKKNDKKEKANFAKLQKQTKYGFGVEERFLPGTNISYSSNIKVHQFILKELGKKRATEIYSLKLNEYRKIQFLMYENGYKIQFTFGVECISLKTQDEPVLVYFSLVNMLDVSHQ